MKLIIAGMKKEYEEGTTVSALIDAEKVEMPDYVTVSVNEEFVDREKFAVTILKEDDEVEFLYFMGGGGLSADETVRAAGAVCRTACPAWTGGKISC